MFPKVLLILLAFLVSVSASPIARAPGAFNIRPSLATTYVRLPSLLPFQTV